MSIHIGISGWTYGGWRGTFYPEDLPAKKELYFASHALPSIEVNGTFYGLQRPTSYAKWFETTPDNFVFSVKANRFITHVKRLKDIEVPMANFMASGILKLKHKLGPILWQFPPSMKFDPDKFKNFLSLLPRNHHEVAKLGKKSSLAKNRIDLSYEENLPLRHAVEIRNESFLNPWFLELLREHKVALVFADTAGKWPYMEDMTADFLYIRLHGDSELYVSGYDDATLNFWADRIKKWANGEEPKDRLTLLDEKHPLKKRDIYLYFDNDAKVRAPVDAKNLIHKLSLAQGLLQPPLHPLF